MTAVTSLPTSSHLKYSSCIFCTDNLDIDIELVFFLNNLILKLLVHEDHRNSVQYKITNIQ